MNQSQWPLLIVFAGAIAAGCVKPSDPNAIDETPAVEETSSLCCAPSESTGCAEATTEQCVCAEDSACCENGWDDLCAWQVAALGCGSCEGVSADTSCAVDADCDASAPTCSKGSCWRCSGDAACAAARPSAPHCGADGRCGECAADSDCGALHCEAGRCVECRTSADCTNGGACEYGFCG